MVTTAGGTEVLIHSSYSVINHNKRTEETIWINGMITFDSISKYLKGTENRYVVH